MSLSLSLWCEEAEDEEQVPGSAVPSSRPRAAWDPVASGQRVIQRLLQVEQRYLPSRLYAALVQRDPEDREELAKWALEVCCERGCDEAVFPLSVSLMDRFLSASLSASPSASLPVSPHCLMASCILVASKLTECDNVTADALCAAAEYSFVPSSLRDMERLLLAALRWDTAAVTPQDFLPHLVAAVGRVEDGEPPPSSTLRRHGDTLAAMCVCDSRFLGAPPSLVAAAALDCALRGLSGVGAARLEDRSRGLAALCRTDPVALRCYSEMIEHVLRRRLTGGPGASPTEKGQEVEEERAATPTDMRDVDF